MSTNWGLRRVPFMDDRPDQKQAFDFLQVVATWIGLSIWILKSKDFLCTSIGFSLTISLTLLISVWQLIWISLWWETVWIMELAYRVWTVSSNQLIAIIWKRWKKMNWQGHEFLAIILKHITLPRKPQMQ